MATQLCCLQLTNQHLGYQQILQQIQHILKFPNVSSTSRDVDSYSYLLFNVSQIGNGYIETIFLPAEITTTAISKDEICMSVVSTFLDSTHSQDNEFSLRDAIIVDNQQENGGEIHLCAGQYKLDLGGRYEDDSALGDLDIHSEIIIIGDSKQTTTIDGNNLDRIFQVFPGEKLELHNLTLLGGDALNFNGGAIITSDMGDLFGISTSILQANFEHLTDNGGATQTHALSGNSLAIDNGDPQDFSTDQRNFNHSFIWDIGAFEYNGLSPSNSDVIKVEDIFLDSASNSGSDLALLSPDIRSDFADLLDEKNADLAQFFAYFPFVVQQLHAIGSDDLPEIIL